MEPSRAAHIDLAAVLGELGAEPRRDFSQQRLLGHAVFHAASGAGFSPGSCIRLSFPGGSITGAQFREHETADAFPSTVENIKVASAVAVAAVAADFPATAGLGCLEAFSAADVAARVRGAEDGTAWLRVPAAPAPLCRLEVSFEVVGDDASSGSSGGGGVRWGDDTSSGGRYCVGALIGPPGTQSLGPPGGAVWFPWLIGTPSHCTYSLLFEVREPPSPPLVQQPSPPAGGVEARPLAAAACTAPITVVASGVAQPCQCSAPLASRCSACAPHATATGLLTPGAVRWGFRVAPAAPASAVGFAAGPLVPFDRGVGAALPMTDVGVSLRLSSGGAESRALPSPPPPPLVLQSSLSRMSSVATSASAVSASGDGGSAGQASAASALPVHFLCSAALLAASSPGTVAFHTRRARRLVAFLCDWLAAPLPASPHRHVYLPACVLPSTAALAGVPTTVGSGGAPSALLWAHPERDVVALAGLTLFPDELLLSDSSAGAAVAVDTASTAHALQALGLTRSWFGCAATAGVGGAISDVWVEQGLAAYVAAAYLRGVRGEGSHALAIAAASETVARIEATVPGLAPISPSACDEAARGGAVGVMSPVWSEYMTAKSFVVCHMLAARVGEAVFQRVARLVVQTGIAAAPVSAQMLLDCGLGSGPSWAGIRGAVGPTWTTDQFLTTLSVASGGPESGGGDVGLAAAVSAPAGEACSAGFDAPAFAAQWLQRTGVPHFTAAWAVDLDRKVIDVVFEQLLPPGAAFFGGPIDIEVCERAVDPDAAAAGDCDIWVYSHTVRAPREVVSLPIHDANWCRLAVAGGGGGGGRGNGDRPRRSGRGRGRGGGVGRRGDAGASGLSVGNGAMVMGDESVATEAVRLAAPAPEAAPSDAAALGVSGVGASASSAAPVAAANPAHGSGTLPRQRQRAVRASAPAPVRDDDSNTTPVLWVRLDPGRAWLRRVTLTAPPVASLALFLSCADAASRVDALAALSSVGTPSAVYSPSPLPGPAAEAGLAAAASLPHWPTAAAKLLKPLHGGGATASSASARAATLRSDAGVAEALAVFNAAAAPGGSTALWLGYELALESDAVIPLRLLAIALDLSPAGAGMGGPGDPLGPALRAAGLPSPAPQPPLPQQLQGARGMPQAPALLLPPAQATGGPVGATAPPPRVGFSGAVRAAAIHALGRWASSRLPSYGGTPESPAAADSDARSSRPHASWLGAAALLVAFRLMWYAGPAALATWPIVALPYAPPTRPAAPIVGGTASSLSGTQQASAFGATAAAAAAAVAAAPQPSAVLSSASYGLGASLFWNSDDPHVCGIALQRMSASQPSLGGLGSLADLEARTAVTSALGALRHADGLSPPAATAALARLLPVLTPSSGSSDSSTGSDDVVLRATVVLALADSATRLPRQGASGPAQTAQLHRPAAGAPSSQLPTSDRALALASVAALNALRQAFALETLALGSSGGCGGGLVLAACITALSALERAGHAGAPPTTPLTPLLLNFLPPLRSPALVASSEISEAADAAPRHVVVPMRVRFAAFASLADAYLPALLRGVGAVACTGGTGPVGDSAVADKAPESSPEAAIVAYLFSFAAAPDGPGHTTPPAAALQEACLKHLFLLHWHSDGIDAYETSRRSGDPSIIECDIAAVRARFVSELRSAIVGREPPVQHIAAGAAAAAVSPGWPAARWATVDALTDLGLIDGDNGSGRTGARMQTGWYERRSLGALRAAPPVTAGFLSVLRGSCPRLSASPAAASIASCRSSLWRVVLGGNRGDAVILSGGALAARHLWHSIQGLLGPPPQLVAAGPPPESGASSASAVALRDAAACATHLRREALRVRRLAARVSFLTAAASLARAQAALRAVQELGSAGVALSAGLLVLGGDGLLVEAQGGGGDDGAAAGDAEVSDVEQPEAAEGDGDEVDDDDGDSFGAKGAGKRRKGDGGGLVGRPRGTGRPPGRPPGVAGAKRMRAAAGAESGAGGPVGGGGDVA